MGTVFAGKTDSTPGFHHLMVPTRDKSTRQPVYLLECLSWGRDRSGVETQLPVQQARQQVSKHVGIIGLPYNMQMCKGISSMETV